MNNESSHIYSQRPKLGDHVPGERGLMNVTTSMNITSNSNESMVSVSDGVVIDVISFIQGYHTDCFQFLDESFYRDSSINKAISRTYGSRQSIEEELIENDSVIKNNGSVMKLRCLADFNELPIEVSKTHFMGLSHSCKDLLTRFFIPLAKRVRYLQLICENVLSIGPEILGQSIVDYCQKEVKNIILVRYYEYVNFAAGTINSSRSNTTSLVSLMNGLNNLEEYFMILESIKVFEEYIKILNEKLDIDKEVAEFQMFMKTLKENNSGSSNRNDHEEQQEKDKDEWISYDTRLSETPQGNTVMALIWQHARIPFKKRNLQVFNKFSVSRHSCTNDDVYVPGCKVMERFLYLLNDWILNGNLVQAESDCSSKFDFFITDVLGHSSKLRNERLWEIKFNIVKDGLDDFIKFVQPCFEDKELLWKVLVIGKLKHLYNIFASQLPSEQNLAATLEWPILDLFIWEDKAQFHAYLNTHYTNSNKLVLQMFENKYQSSTLIPQIISFYQCKSYSDHNKLSLFLNNSLLDLTKYPTEFNLRNLQNKFQVLCNVSYASEKEEWMSMLNLKFDELTVLDHINNFKLLQKDSPEAENGGQNKLEYNGNFQDFKRLVLPAFSLENSISDLVPTSHKPIKKNIQNKLVSINFFKFQLEVPFPLSIILNKTVAVQLEMIQRKLMNYYYMEKIMVDIHLEMSKQRVWDLASTIEQLNLKKIKKLHYRMKFFTKFTQEYINNGVLSALNMPVMGDNVTLAEYVFDLNSYLTNVMIKSWLTNSDVSECEFNVLQLIFQFCKFVTHLRSKLEQILILADEDPRSSEIDILIKNISMKFEKYERSFNEWLQLYIECVYAEFARSNDEESFTGNESKGLNGVFLKKFLRDLECILSY